MYTEDDEDVKVENKSSNGDYNDFYTSFNSLDKKEEAKGKKEKKEPVKEENIEVKDEDDYSDFYDTDGEIVVDTSKRDKIKTIIKIGIIMLLAVVLGVLVLILINKNREPDDIELSKSSFSLKVGEKEHISYRIIDPNNDVTSKFTSSNPKVAIVDENGEITAVGVGQAIITIHYTVNGKEKSIKCTVKVLGEKETVPTPISPTPTSPPVKKDLTLSLKPSTTSWSNKDVTITVDAASDYNITSLQYAINCSSNCNYSNVVNNKIVISSNGTTNVRVVAKDSKKEVTKEVTVKIDKEATTATLDGDSNIVSNIEANVCVACTDTISGCKQAKVCKKFTSSQSNQVITVYDNAGNSKSSPVFNVTINKVNPPCSLKVSSDGTVSAILGETPIYYGFDASCTGSNELSRKITISASKKGEKGAKLVNYYIKNKKGNIGSCYVTVIKECECTDPKSTDANCPVTCTFRAN